MASNSITVPVHGEDALCDSVASSVGSNWVFTSMPGLPVEEKQLKGDDTDKLVIFLKV